MKKKISALFIIIMGALLLVGCGKNEYVKETESLIEEIGEVSVASGTRIQNARKKYELLTEEDKKKVDNYYTLADAEEKYNSLVEENKRKIAESEAISAKVNIDTALTKIENAKANYDEMIPTVMSKWQSVGFEKLFNGGDMSAYTQEFKDLCSDYKSKKNSSDSDLSSANTLLNGISEVPDEYRDYYESVKDAYAKVKTYGLLTDYPEGYSKLTYQQAYSSYKSEAESALSAASIKK